MKAILDRNNKRTRDIPILGTPASLRAGQPLKGEHSFVGAPASLYNLTKSAPDPCYKIKKRSQTI